MESTEVAATPNTVLEKLLANESLGRANGSSYNGRVGGAGAEFGFMRTPTSSNAKKTVLPSLHSALHSGVSGFKVPVSADISKTTSMIPLMKIGITNDLKSEKPTNSLGEALGGIKQHEQGVGMLNGGVETGKKSRGGKGSRGGGATRKRPRASQAGCLMNMADKADTSGGVLAERAGDAVRADEAVSHCKAVGEKIEKKTRRRPGVKGLKRGEKRSSQQPATRVTGERLSVTGGVNGTDWNHSGPGILDIYGLKTKPVDLSRFMEEIPLNDLIAGEYKLPKFAHEVIEPQRSLKRESFYLEINDILQHIPKRPVEAIISSEVPVAVNVSMIDKGHCSASMLDHGSSIKRSCDDVESDTHGNVKKNFVESPLMQAVLCSEVADRGEVPELGATTQDFASMQMASNLNRAFLVDGLPLKSYRDCIKSLNLPPCEPLDNLIAQAMLEPDVRLTDPPAILGSFNNGNNSMIPPLPYSHPPVGTSKTDLGHERGVTKGKATQGQWIKGASDTNESLRDKSSEGGLQEDFEIGGTSLNREIRPPDSKYRKTELGGRTDSKVKFAGNTQLSLACSQVGIKDDSAKHGRFPEAILQESVSAMDIEVKPVLVNAQLGDQLKRNLEQVDHRLRGYDSPLTEGATRLEESIVFNAPQQAEINQLNRNPFTNVLEGLSRDIQGHGAIQDPGRFQGPSSGSAKHGNRHDFRFEKAVKLCCDGYLSHLPNNMPDQPVSPRVFTASCILYHMANDLPFSELEKAEKKTRRRSLQPYPGAPSQKPPKSFKLGHSAAGPVAVPTHTNNGRKDSGSKANETVIPNKLPAGERKKSLSQVGDTFPGSTKSSMPTVHRATGWLSNGVRGMANGVGSSSANRLLRSEKGGQIHARENSRAAGKGPAPCMTSPTKSFLGSVSRGNQSMPSRGNPPCPPNQRGMSSPKVFFGGEAVKGAGVGAGKTSHPFSDGVGAGNSVGRSQLSFPSCFPVRTSRQMFPPFAESRQKTKQESSRGRWGKP